MTQTKIFHYSSYLEADPHFTPQQHILHLYNAKIPKVSLTTRSIIFDFKINLRTIACYLF